MWSQGPIPFSSTFVLVTIIYILRHIILLDIAFLSSSWHETEDIICCFEVMGKGTSQNVCYKMAAQPLIVLETFDLWILPTPACKQSNAAEYPRWPLASVAKTFQHNSEFSGMFHLFPSHTFRVWEAILNLCLKEGIYQELLSSFVNASVSHFEANKVLLF